MTDDSKPSKSPLMSRKDAAEYLGVTEGTLAVWKCTSRYPLKCIKIGRLAKYRKSDLDEFIEAQQFPLAA